MMSGRACRTCRTCRTWKTSRPGRDTFLPRRSSGSMPVGTTNANTKALMGGDVGRGPVFRWNTSGRLPSFAATMSGSFVFCALPIIAWRPNMSTGRNSSNRRSIRGGRSMKGGDVGKCRSPGHRCLELHSGSQARPRVRPHSPLAAPSCTASPPSATLRQIFLGGTS